MAVIDVMTFTPLLAVAGDLYLRILKERSRLYIHVSLTCVYLV